MGRACEDHLEEQVRSVTDVEKLPCGVDLPAEGISAKRSPLGCGVYKRSICLCECYFRRRTDGGFLAESFTAAFVVETSLCVDALNSTSVS